MASTHGKPGKYITSKHNKGVRGYYLALPSGDRHWLGEAINDAARVVDQVCDKHLRAEDGYEYWIDYCQGYDVKGNLAWVNVDQTDTILHHAENI